MKKIYILICFLFLSLFILINSSNSQWFQYTAGIYGGRIYSFVSSGTKLYAGTQGGVYLTTDGGTVWSKMNNGLTSLIVYALANSGNIVFAGTDNKGVFITYDGGNNWTQTGLSNQTVWALAVNGASPDTTIYAGLYNSVMKSTNRGTTWSTASSGLPANYITCFSVNEAYNTVFAGMQDSGVYRTTNNGVVWIAANGGLTNKRIMDLYYDGNNLYAATQGGGIFKSSNSGNSWTTVNGGMFSMYVNSLTQNSGYMYAGTTNGIYRSTNYGTNWTVINTGLGLDYYIEALGTYSTKIVASPYHYGVYSILYNGNTWSEINYGMTPVTIQGLAYDGSYLYSSAYNGIFRTNDYGFSWTKIISGLNVKDILELYSFLGTHVFAGTYSDGVYMSSNSGNNWSAVNSGLATPFQAFYAFTSIGTNLFAGNDGNGVYVTTNYGTNWTTVNSGLSNLQVRALANDAPKINTLDKVEEAFLDYNLYAGTYGGGVFKSTNQGLNWSAVNSGLTNFYIYSLDASGQVVFASTFNGVFRSTNAGANWTTVNSGLATGELIYSTKIVQTTNDGGNWSSLGNVIAGGYYGMYINTFTGSTWKTSIALGLPPSLPVNKVMKIPDYLFSGLQGGGVYRRQIYELQPGITTLLTPANNATGVAVNPLFDWTDVSTTTNYLIQIYSNAAGTALVFADSGFTSSQYQLGTGILNTGTDYWWKVTAKNFAGSWMPSSLYKFTTSSPIPSPPVLSYPPLGASYLPSNINFKWFKSQGALTYHFQLSSDESYNNIVVNDSTITDSLKYVTGLLPSQTVPYYYWRVRAKNVSGYSAFSSGYFSTKGLPGYVDLVYPLHLSFNLPVNLSFRWNKVWDSTGSSGKNILKYWLEYSTDSSFSTKLLDSNLTDTIKTVSGLMNHVRYFWRVKAKNEIGWGNFSGHNMFYTVVPSPTIPALISPSNGSINQPLTPTLDWSDVLCANSYKLQVSTNSGFTTTISMDSILSYNWIYRNTGIATGNVQSFVVKGTTIFAGLYSGGLYKSTNYGQNWTLTNFSAAYAVYSLFIKGTLLLAGSSNGVWSSTDDGNTWSQIGLSGTPVYTMSTKEPPSVAPKEKIFLNENMNDGTYLFAGTNNGVYRTTNDGLNWTIMNSGLTNLNITSFTKINNSLFVSTAGGGVYVFDDGTWFTKSTGLGSNNVKAIASLGTDLYACITNFGVYKSTNYGDNWYETTSGVFGTQVYCLYADKEKMFVGLQGGAAVSTNGGTNWLRLNKGSYGTYTNAMTAVGDSIFIGTSNAGVSIGNVLSQYSIPSGKLSNGTLYYWRVRAENIAGIGSYSSPYTFTTIALAPDPPVLSYPSSGQTGIPIMPALEWSDVQGAEKYFIQLSGDSLFTATIINDSNTSSFYFIPSGKLAHLTKYYWRAASKGAGGTSQWSTIFNFTTVVSLPPVVTLTSPSNGATNVSVTPTMNWSTSGYEYGLQIVTDANFTANLIASTPNQLSISTNNGTNWSNYPNPPTYSVFQFYKFNQILFAGGTAGLFKTSNNGVNWTQCFSTYTSGITSIGNNLFAATDGGILRSSNNGNNWNTVNNGLTSVNIKSIISAGSYLVAGSNDSGIFRSTNMGNVWIRTYSLPSQINSLSTNGFYVYAGKYGTNQFLVSNDFGLTWIETGSGTLELTKYKLLSFDNYVLAGTENGVFASSNNGYQWNTLGLSGQTVMSFAKYDSYIFAATLSGVYRTTNLGVNWIQMNSGLPDVMVYSIYNFNNTVFDTTGITVPQYNVQSGLLNYGTQYYWRVNAKNAGGSSSWSIPFNFTTLSQVPAVPVLVSPMNSSTGNPLSLNLIWHKSLYATNYHVQVSTDTLFATLIVNDSTLTDSIKAVSGLSSLTNYYWRVRAKNASGSSAFTSRWSFRTLGPPAQVTLNQPLNNSVNQPVNNVIFKWFKPAEQTDEQLIKSNELQKQGGNESNEFLTISKYWFEYSTDSNFAVSIIDTTLTDTLKTLSGLLNNTKYYWRVKAKNEIGWGIFSNVWNFTTTPVPAPTTPALVSPANNTIDLIPPVTLDWSTSSGAAFYHIQLSTNIGFTSLIINDSLKNSTDTTITNLSSYTNYYWRVRAGNAGGYSSFTSAWTFRTLGLPNQVVLNSPPNGGINIPVNVTFKWYKPGEQTDALNNSKQQEENINLKILNKLSGDAILRNQLPVRIVNGSDALTITKYWFEYSTDSLFASSVIDTTVTDTLKMVSNLSFLTKYYWRVKAKNSMGWGAFSEVWEFRTRSSVIPAPVLLQPVNGATGLTLTPVLDWDTLTMASGYQLQLSIDSSFSTNIIDSSNIPVTNYLVPGTLLDDTTLYYWRVRGVNPFGFGNWSFVFNFRTKSIITYPVIPQAFRLYENYPNPFNPATKIKFDIPEPTKATIKIYDITGREVSKLLDRYLEAGSYEVDFNAMNLSSGVYFYRLETEKYINVKRMVLIK